MRLSSSYFFLTLLLFVANSSYSQLPQEEKLNVRVSKEIWMGAVFHSNGFGVNLDIAKFKTYKKKSLLHFELINMKHNKEYKMLGFGDESAKKYVYGKLNYVNVLRLGIGRRKLVFEKFRNNGVQFTANFSSGLSLGCARPVYLQIYKRDFNGVPIAVVPERYDASQHGYYDIYGRGPRFRGLFEYSFNPGIYFRAGLESDYSVVPEIIQSIEVGIAVDAYLNEIEIMANNSPSYYFATLYLNFSLGNKFY